MILLLSTKESPAIDPALAELGPITPIRVPAPPPKRDTPRPAAAMAASWAYKTLTDVDQTVREGSVTAVVCADPKSRLFAQRLAERHPQLPVLSDQQIAARLLSELQDRGVVPSRRAVHDLLDPLRPSHSTIPEWLLNRDARPKTIVSLVPGPIADFPEAQQATRALADSGFASVLMGATSAQDQSDGWGLLGEALTINFSLDPGLGSPDPTEFTSAVPSGAQDRDSQSAGTIAEQQIRQELLLVARRTPSPLNHRIRRRLQRWRTRLLSSNTPPATSQKLHQSKGNKQQSGQRAGSGQRQNATQHYGALDAVFRSALDDLLPHAIYVHDLSLLGIAVRARNRLQLMGVSSRLMYQLPRVDLVIADAQEPHDAELHLWAKELLATFDVGLAKSTPEAMAIQSTFELNKSPAVFDNPTPLSATADSQLPQSVREETATVVRVVEDHLGEAGAPATQIPQLLLGAENSAGQAHEWTRSLRELGIEAKSIVVRSSEPIFGFGYPVDIEIPARALGSLDRQVNLLLNLVAHCPHVIIESGNPIAAPHLKQTQRRRLGFAEARALQAAGKNVGLIFHGSDIRRPDIHIETHEWSPFKDPSAAQLTERLLKHTRITHQELVDWHGPVMVSTPDLLSLTPRAHWVPVAIDLSDFNHAGRPANETSAEPPLVVHLPSSSIKKGSHLIDPVLRELATDGVIRYAHYRHVPHSEVPALMAQADIFVDQMGMGILGVAGVEAMASGAVLVTDPGPEALDAYGEPVPLCVANPSTLASTIRELAADQGQRRELALAGRDFVERHHDGRKSAAAIVAAMGLEVSRP